jgi:hypothetical protein
MDCSDCNTPLQLIGPCPTNLPISSINRIWSFFTGYSSTTIKACFFQQLLTLTELTFNETRLTPYHIYLHLKPCDHSDPDYEKILDATTALLVGILWNELIDFLDIPNSKLQDANRKLYEKVNCKTLPQIERDVELLYSNSSWLCRKDIWNSYGFNMPTSKLNPRKVLTKFNCCRSEVRYISSEFNRYYINDRRESSFANAIYCSSTSCSEDSMIFKCKVNVNYLKRYFDTLGYRWSWNFIDYIEDIITDEEEYIEHYMPKVDIKWVKASFPKIMVIIIEECDGIRFLSPDDELHNLTETNSDWKPISNPRYRIESSTDLDDTLYFRDSGTVYLKDNYNPDSIRLIVKIKRTINTLKLFNKVITSRQLLPSCHIVGHRFTDTLRLRINRYLLAETIMNRLSWGLLRIFRFPDHSILVQSLSIEQLVIIHEAKTICSIVANEDHSSTWTLLISNLGNALLSKALRALTKCSSNNNDRSLDLNKEALAKWYRMDRNYAVVAMCNTLKPNGKVDIGSLAGQIAARAISSIRAEQ